MYRHFWEGGPGGKSSLPNPGFWGRGGAPEQECAGRAWACCKTEGMENEAGPTQRDGEKREMERSPARGSQPGSLHFKRKDRKVSASPDTVMKTQSDK